MNGDGFIVAEEIGITAGVTEKGEFPTFEELIERARWKASPKEEEGFKPVPYQSIDRIQGKNLAVVGLESEAGSIDTDTAKGVITFIENALVNVGKVRVVDRRNIEKIVEEHKFQVSALTDNSTAVEIGKLSGADIIVFGVINYVGEKYYLNIKMLQVETGEILGSSIAEAAGDVEFFDMCNEAVYALF